MAHGARSGCRPPSTSSMIVVLGVIVPTRPVWSRRAHRCTCLREGSNSSTMFVKGEPADPASPPDIGYTMVRGDWFRRALKIPIVAWPQPSTRPTRPDGPKVAMINESAARFYFPHGKTRWIKGAHRPANPAAPPRHDRRSRGRHARRRQLGEKTLVPPPFTTTRRSKRGGSRSRWSCALWAIP